MKKLILIAVLMLVSSSVFAQDIFGPPNYFFKRNDSVFVREGSVFGSAPSTFDSIYFNVLHSRTGSSNIYTNGTNGRRLNISNTSGEDSMRIQMTTLGNGGLVINEYGAVYVGNAGNADANDSINFKVALNNTYWRFAQGWTSNGQSGDATTGIGALLPNNADSIIFRGLTGLNTGKYNFIGSLSTNKITHTGSVNETAIRTITATQDTILATNRLVLLSGASNTVNAVLPKATTCPGLELQLICINVDNATTFTAFTGDEIIGGFAAFGLQYDFITLKNDGVSKWYAVAYFMN